MGADPTSAILAIVGLSLSVGLKPAFKLIVGILLGDLIYIAIVLLGLAANRKIFGELFYIIMFVSILGTSLTLYAYAASRARSFFGDPRKLRTINRSAGTMLIGAGIAAVAKK